MTLDNWHKHFISYAFRPLNVSQKPEEIPNFGDVWPKILDACKANRFLGMLLDTGDVKNRRFDKQIFLGNGYHSVMQTSILHDRLRYAISELSALQQGINSESDEARQIDRSIRNVIRDVAAALLGETIEFTGKIETPVEYPENEDPFLKNL